ncbi:hypothetical protein [Segatella hominis]|uniref:hypothetical protein n=1 Tax=Segatella hominis TaxID=2518605 RepID=UPI003AAB0143
MIWVIIVAVIVFIAFKIGSTSGQVVGSMNNSGGMRVKYARLLENILSGHKDSKVFVETRTYLRAGVSNYGGTTLFHIQQSTGNKVIIQYEVKDNPAVPAFQSEWVFPDDMDQDEMMVVISNDIQKKMVSYFGNQ